jgi:SAM-dependent methyltransferase
MLLWRRLLTSIGKRGLKKTIQLVPQKTGVYLSKLDDQLFDIRNGTDTLEIVELDQLQIDSENKEKGIRYEPTRARPFFKVLNSIKLPADATFIDFGCGKGRVLMMAAEYGFRRVTGVDFSKELCDRAYKNISTYQSRRRNGTDIDILNMDAVDYPVRAEDTVFYFFNPFDETVLGRVLDNITASLNSSPRTVWLIYHNPLWSYVIERWSMFRKISTHEHAECRFFVYSNKK